MDGGKIIENTATFGGGVTVDISDETTSPFNTIFTMNDGLIKGNEADLIGGGVLSIGMFTLNGGIIEGNSALVGGGVYTLRTQSAFVLSANFIMEDGVIRYNEAYYLGGGVAVDTGIAIMNGGSISNNSIISAGPESGGGGVWVGDYIAFIMGVNPIFTMSGGEIIGNTANTIGGGIYISEGEVNISGNAEIINNTATENGGGIYLTENGTLDIVDGSIVNNATDGNGGGIFTEIYEIGPLPTPGIAYSNITIGEDVIFNNNTAGNGAYPPPVNAVDFIDIQFASTSVYNHPLNNYDINYTSIRLLVTFDLQGGNIGGNLADVVVNVPYRIPGTNINLPAPVKAGHNLLGWMTDDGTKITDWSEIVITEDTIFYAIWANESQVIFILQGGNIGGDSANVIVSNVVYGTSLGGSMPPNPTRPSHTFIGWFDTPLSGGNQFTITTIVYGDKTVYARWRAAGGGSGGGGTGTGTDTGNGDTTPPSVFSAYHEAYLVGFPDGTIRPNNTITRAEVATIFFRLLDDDYRIQVWSQNNPFRDVILTNWFNNAVSTLANADIVEGFPDNTFRGTQAITRAEFVTMVVRFLDDTNYAGSDRFNDISGHWAREYINIAGQYDWIVGFGGGDFRPNQNITRAEAAAIVNRMLERQPESAYDLLPGMVTWPDNMNQNAWFYLYIQEATNSHDFEVKADGVHERWTELREARDWTVLERPNSRPQDILN